MSGDKIDKIKMVQEQPLNLQDLEYTKRLLEPFEDLIIVERFNGQTTPSNKKIFYLISIGLVLFINFPNIRSKAGINEYILWAISAVILLLLVI
jgi:hypothetical protein